MSDQDDTADPTDRMVLRTVYLPPELDERLRVLAFRTKVSKGDVIRLAIARELEKIEPERTEPPAKKVQKSGQQSIRAKSKTKAGTAKAQAR